MTTHHLPEHPYLFIVVQQADSWFEPAEGFRGKKRKKRKEEQKTKETGGLGVRDTGTEKVSYTRNVSTA